MDMLSNYLKVLALVARADGEIAPEEVSAIHRAIDGVFGGVFNVGEVHSILDMSSAVDEDLVLRGCISDIDKMDWTPLSRAAYLAELIRDCYVIAVVDGRLRPQEEALIDRLLELGDVPVQRRATLHNWAEAAARQTLDGAELFLDCIAGRE